MWVLSETDLGDNSKKEQHLQFVIAPQYLSLMVNLCFKLCQALNWNTYQIEQCENYTLKEEIFSESNFPVFVPNSQD